METILTFISTLVGAFLNVFTMFSSIAPKMALHCQVRRACLLCRLIVPRGSQDIKIEKLEVPGFRLSALHDPNEMFVMQTYHEWPTPYENCVPCKMDIRSKNIYEKPLTFIFVAEPIGDMPDKITVKLVSPEWFKSRKVSIDIERLD